MAQAIWIKCREGRNPFRGEFSIYDWQDVGVVAAQGAGGGAVAGGALYLLTHSTALAAPFAGSLVSGLMGIGVLLRDHYAGTIDGDQFVEMSHIVAMDAGAVGLASAAGQIMIPVPLLGALLGGLAGKLVTSALKDGLRESKSALIASLAEYERYAFGQLDEEFRAVMQTIGRLVRKPGTLGRDRLRPRGEPRALESQHPDGEDCRRARRADSPHDRRSRHLHAEVTMDALHNPLDGLSPALYVATLSEIAHADGLHPAERELLEHHAAHFGVDLDDLPAVPRDLSALPWATRVLVFRDAVTLAQVDGMSAEEERYLDVLAERMALPAETAGSDLPFPAVKPGSAATACGLLDWPR